ncbi:MAG TPA: ABC transporter permease [Vicinamibacterales bacterium]
MRILTQIRMFIRTLTRRSAVEREMAAELDFHMDSYAEDLIRGGAAPDEARRLARLAFGAVESKKEGCRASLGVRLVDELSADTRFALRSMRKSPGFAFVVILTLAIGIGANTAIFTLVDAVLLRPATVPHPEQLYEVSFGGPGTTGRPSVDASFTNAIWEALRSQQDAFSGMAAWGDDTFNLARGGAVDRVGGMWVSGDFFPTLEVQPAIGRLIAPNDDRRGCPSIAVLSYDFWQSRYGGAADVLGSTLSVNGQPFEIVGVSARGFNGLDIGRRFDVAAPNCATAALDDPVSRLDVRDDWWLWIAGRVKSNLSAEQANARLAAVARHVMESALPTDWSHDMQQQFLRRTLTAIPAAAGIQADQALQNRFGRPLWLLLGVVGLVLLIACANVAALMLARASAQARDLAVRLALGAGRMRIVRQLLVFSMLLSFAGAVAGVMLARWSTPVLVRGISTHADEVVLNLSPDWRIAAFTSLVALATGVLLGVLPGFRSTRVPLTVTTRGAGAIESHSALRTWIVAGQMALSLVVLVASALLLRSFIDVVRVDPGFDSRNVLLVTVPLWSSDIPAERNFSTFEALQARFAGLPGIVALGRSYHIPLTAAGWNDPVRSDSPNAPTGRNAVSLMNFVSAGYFNAMRVRLLAGRDVTAADSATAPRVAILNEAAARKFFPGADPLGHVIQIGKPNGKSAAPIHIVGVVADSTYRSLKVAMPSTIFFPLAQIPNNEGENTYAIRTLGPPDTLRTAVIAAAADLGRDIPLDFNTLQTQVDDAMVQDRLLATLSGFFGAVALLLAMVGLYGSVSYRVATRAGEFGVCIALGADAGAIVRLVLRDVAGTVGVGVIAGIALSLAAASALRTLLYGIGPYDPGTIGTAAIALTVVATIAALMPARRAARVDPIIALRAE